MPGHAPRIAHTTTTPLALDSMSLSRQAHLGLGISMRARAAPHPTDPWQT